MARWKCRTQKSPKIRHPGTIAQIFSGYIFATKARIDNLKKSFLNSNVSPICPHNMVNFGPLAAEIRWQISTGCTSWQHYCTAL